MENVQKCRILSHAGLICEKIKARERESFAKYIWFRIKAFKCAVS